MPRAVKALLWRDLRGFGAALTSSHRASRRFLWNIVPEIDNLQHIALSLGAAGATGFGAGFGGSIVAVLSAVHAASFIQEWEREYERRHPEAVKEARFFLTSPGSGIVLWDMDGEKRLVDLMFGG